ncbi:MAG TPA: hypothetical protein VG797_06905 [Phycisphaerales bacterium]|nr:hypothetical protein [Phycisphaerales bacterium]
MTEPTRQDDVPVPPPVPRPVPHRPRARFTWVPEWTVTGPTDPWAARKGEPRVFALLWCCYLFAAATVTLFAVRSVGPARSEQFQYGARGLLVLVAIGTVALWPLARLSQASPDRTIRATIADALILLASVNAIVWPMPVLTRWPWEIAIGLLVMVSAWTLAAGGWVAWGTMPRTTSAARLLAMLICLLFLVTAPVSRLFVPGAGSHQAWEPLTPWGMFSPVTAALALTESPPNLTPVMDRSKWLLVIAPLLLGLPAWFAACRPSGQPDNPPKKGPDSSGAD